MVRGVTIRDLTAAYASIENKGTYREARTYTKVLDSDGNVVLDNTQSSNENMSEKTAYYLTYMMEETVKDGTGQEAQVPGIDTAGKTGTTSDDKDRWFAGYTGYYTGVVWCGYDQPQEVVLEDDSIENPASVLFNKVMTKVHEGKQNKAFEKPTSVIDVEVCQDSGNLVNDWCTKDIRGDRTVTIQLDGSDVPTSYCSTHVETDICTAGDTLHVANDSCKSRGTVTQYGLLNLSRQFPIAGIVVADQQYCVGTLVKRSGYSEARCDTMDPVNAVCTIHGTQRTTVTTRYDNDDDNTGGTEQDPSESDPVVSMPAVQ